MTQFWNFGTQLISREPWKLETSNLARGLTAGSSNDKNSKLGEKGSCGGHVTQFFLILGPANISRTVNARNFKFGTQMDDGEI